MTAWSTAALLVFGIAIGPHGLNLLPPSVLLLVDPGVAMALAMLGVFVGLSIDPTYLRTSKVIAASTIRSVTVIAVVGGAVAAFSVYWLAPGSPRWLLALTAGVCAATSDAASDDVSVDDLLMIVAGGAIVAAMHASGTAVQLLLVSAVMAIAAVVAFAGWLLVGQTSSEAEQHVFVVGSLLLIGGAATYLSLSAVFAGLLAGLTWRVAGNVALARIIRDLIYLQHPVVVLVLVVAGAGLDPSVETVMLAAVFVAMRAFGQRAGTRFSRAVVLEREATEATPLLTSAGLVGIALAVDLYRGGSAPEWAATLLGAVVVGTIVSEALTLIVSPRRVPG